MPMVFGGAPKCGTCAKSVYTNEAMTFEGITYHNNGCFKCSICNEVIGSTAKAGSMNGKVSHRLCFEKQMRESGGKYGGEKVVAGAQAAANKARAEGKEAPASTPAPAKAAPAPAKATPAPAKVEPAPAKVEQVKVEVNDDGDDAFADFYAKKKAQKEARIIAEAAWGKIIELAQGSYSSRKLQEMWDTYDADRSGNIDAAELKTLITAIATDVGASTSEVDDVVAATITCMDRDGDGALTWSEFIGLSVIQKMGNSYDMQEAAFTAQLYEDADDANAAFYAEKAAAKMAAKRAAK